MSRIGNLTRFIHTLHDHIESRLRAGSIIKSKIDQVGNKYLECENRQNRTAKSIFSSTNSFDETAAVLHLIYILLFIALVLGT